MMKSRNTSAAPKVKPGLSPSRLVKVFMHGEPYGRKVNLAAHNNYESLSFALKKLGNNYSMSPLMASNEEDGAVDDNEFDLLYDDMDGARFYLGEVPWEIFVVSVKRIYIIPAEQENENEVCQEEAAADADADADGAGADDGFAAAVDDGYGHEYQSNDSRFN
ncbi:hypothetical protein GUJ93_ZPchr0011g28345 [Zizania palustris]|uniref:Auxin-responsive protein n=1 Tax=Zizania palustris TaxID=103762 RepID=A0A8J5WM52_ZIZPA|nr:hypothetical protein GUJ93_ZPchr0011g28345 [Zizania palustris]